MVDNFRKTYWYDFFPTEIQKPFWKAFWWNSQKMGSTEKCLVSSHPMVVIQSCFSSPLLSFLLQSLPFFPTLSSADTAFSAVCEDDLPRLANKCGMKSLAVTTFWYYFHNNKFERHQFSAHGMSPRNFIFVVNMLKVTTKLRLKKNYKRAHMSPIPIIRANYQIDIGIKVYTIQNFLSTFHVHNVTSQVI